MTGAEINAVLNDLAIDHPVELADIEAIREMLAPTPGLEVFHGIRLLTVRVRDGASVRFERILPVAGAPAMIKIGAA